MSKNLNTSKDKITNKDQENKEMEIVRKRDRDRKSDMEDLGNDY